MKEKCWHVPFLDFYPNFEFYNGVKYEKMMPKYTTYFLSSKIKNKRKLFLDNLFSFHRQLYWNQKKHFQDSNTQIHAIKNKGMLTPDWLSYYDNYVKQSRHPKFTYGKEVLSARIWVPKEENNQDYLINFSRSINGQLEELKPVKIISVHSEFTNTFCQQEN